MTLRLAAASRLCPRSLGASEPRTSYSERARARELVERLVAEGRVRIAASGDDEVAEWRRVLNYAKRHGLEPEGKRIEKVPYGGPGTELFLAEGLIPMRGVNGGKRAGAWFPSPHDWGTCILSWPRSKMTSADWSCRLPCAAGRSCCYRGWRLRRYGAGTRCGRTTRPSTHARAEWTLLSTASPIPSPSGRSSRSQRIPTAPRASSWSSPMA